MSNTTTQSLIVNEYNKGNKLFNELIENWKQEFKSRIKQARNSQKHSFNLADAIEKSDGLRTPKDKLFIEYLTFIDSNPLRNNDYYKYVNSYSQGKKLNDSFFKHDLQTLNKYYLKVNENPTYNPFSLSSWKKYVLFMLFKFSGLYTSEMDLIFGVKIVENREYNPLTTIPKVLRANLPKSLKLIEYDIFRANPTFLDIELKINREQDVYSLIDKHKFNQLINLHKDVKDANIEEIRTELKCVYGERVNEVITQERFNNKGQLFKDLTKQEKKFIKKFIQANNIENYVRLHDAVIVLADSEIKRVEFDSVNFKAKEFELPEINNPKKSFYELNEKDEVVTHSALYRDFFEQENFIRVTEQDNDKITIFKDSNNVVKPFNHKTDTVSFLSKNINEYDATKIENQITRDVNNSIYGGFLLMVEKELKYCSDTKIEFGISFKNGFCKYTKGHTQIETLNYKEVNGFFAPHPTQERSFEFIDYKEPCEFERFLTMVSIGKDPIKEKPTDEEEKTRVQFFRMFGYLCHSYKDPSFSPAIILSDEGADDTSRKGGRGKSLITKALEYVRNTKIKSGNEFDGSYRHRFADLDRADNIYVLDDVYTGFNYNDLYTNISGDISCEPKGKTAFTIPFSKAPKFVITTNNAVQYDSESTSTRRRFLEFKLKAYFNLVNKPIDVFKHNLFDDWDNTEWNRFYNFVYACVGYYLEFGLDAPKYDKEEDNYKAYFSNNAIIEEFERIFEIVSKNPDGFNVSTFLNCYQDKENNLKYEKYFNHKNVKRYIDIYIKFHKKDLKYNTGLRKWFNQSVF